MPGRGRDRIGMDLWGTLSDGLVALSASFPGLQTSMDVVILCGGQGARMREETEYRPKPMVEVGGRPCASDRSWFVACEPHDAYPLV